MIRPMLGNTVHGCTLNSGGYSKPPKKTIGLIGEVTPCQNNGKLLWEITFFRTSICQVHHEPLFVSYHSLNWLAILAAAALEGLAPFHLCCISDNHLGVPWFARVGRCCDICDYPPLRWVWNWLILSHNCSIDRKMMIYHHFFWIFSSAFFGQATC